MRLNNRKNDELRPLAIEWDIQSQADSSLLIRMGNTRVICAVTIEESVPPFLKGSGQGWITAEYGMLPAATSTRNQREAVRGRTGRTYEIQRLIGRSLRMMVDLNTLGERTLRVDCDVLNADGGTRTASITGAALAMNRALDLLSVRNLIAQPPAVLPIAAVSVGVVGGVSLLDLDYCEDSQAEVDANFVMTADNRLVEVQGSAEAAPFSKSRFDDLAGLAARGICEIFKIWPQK